MTDESKTSYDEIPYESDPFAQSHPDRLATLGRLFGLSPTPIIQCRVLELGCAAGGNLIPMAFHLPGSEFVGVDLSLRQVELGRQTIHDLELPNIRLEQASILDADRSWGRFDYIICHGVYSWVPKTVQEKILSIASDNLAPQGIAYVSYNTYPGWHMREMIRHMMLYHARQFNEPEKKIEQARALMDFLAGSIPTENNHYGMLLKSELDLIRRCRDSYLFHEHLEEVNAPVYFHQFIESAERHGLQYLGEAEFSTMLTGGFPKETAETLERISRNIISTEQYMDFLRNRFFRQTLLCHQNHPLKRDLSAEDIADLLVASAATPDTETVDLAPGKVHSFGIPGGRKAGTSHPLTKAALLILRQYWPKAVDLPTLVRDATDLLTEGLAGDVEDVASSCQTLAADLLECYSANIVELHIWQAEFTTQVSERPKASGLAVYQAKRKKTVVNQRHEMISLAPVAKNLIRFLDGRRDRAELIQCLSDLVAGGTLVVNQSDGSPADPERIQSVLTEALEPALQALAKAAILVE